MKHSRKKTYTGVVRRMTFAKGLKSEHEAIVLDTGEGPALKLRTKDKSGSLSHLVGYRVRVDGFAAPGMGLLVDHVSDIVVLGSPGRPPRPPRP